MGADEVRARIYRYVLDYPGSHLREIHRDLGIGLGTLRYHLRELEERSLLSSSTERYFRRFFSSSGVSQELRPLLGPLRQERLCRIVRLLLDCGCMRHGELQAALRLPPSTVSHYLEILMNAGIVERRRESTATIYVIADERKVRRALDLVRRRLSDSLVDHALEVYEESFR